MRQLEERRLEDLKRSAERRHREEMAACACTPSSNSASNGGISSASSESFAQETSAFPKEEEKEFEWNWLC